MQPVATDPYSRSASLVAVVDADAALCQRLRARLEALGAEVDAHASANAFLASLAARLPACLIADATLPDWSAAELLAELQRRGLDIPTLVMAASGDVRTAVAVLRHGALDCIEKPFIERALATHVAVLLGH
jgi:FixJ family two-component response regulator